MTARQLKRTYGLWTLDVRPGTYLTRGDIGRWHSERRWTDITEIAEDRMKLDRPHSVKVMRDRNGEPEYLTTAEARVVSGVLYRFERDDHAAFLARREGHPVT